MVDMPGHNMALAGLHFDVSWVKQLTWRINGDGVDAPGAAKTASGLRLTDSFLRVSDDAM